MMKLVLALAGVVCTILIFSGCAKEPAWKAVRHVTQGKLIEFTGRMTYELNGNRWKSKQNITTMNIKYAPRI